MMTNEEIAAEIYVSVNTVKAHLKRIYRKLGVVSRSRGRTPGARARDDPGLSSYPFRVTPSSAARRPTFEPLVNDTEEPR